MPVDLKTSCIGGFFEISTNRLALVIQENQIGHFDETEVDSQTEQHVSITLQFEYKTQPPSLRISPETIRVLWIAQRDMTAHSFAKSIATKHSKCTGHMFKHPTSLVVHGCERWDSRQRHTLRNGLDRLRRLSLLILA